MPRRYIAPDELTEPEAAVQAKQGVDIGPTVNEQPLRRMTAPQLRELLFELVRDGEGSRQQMWYRRQRKKVRDELRRRAG